MSALPMEKTNDLARIRAVGEPIVETPQPLPAELMPVEAFPLDALPNAFRPWVSDVADRMRCPPEFIGLPMIVGASMLVAREVAIQPQEHTDWTERANLWGAIVAPPGWMKSPAMKEALAPIERMEAREASAHREAMEAFKVELLAHKLRAEAGEKKAKTELAKNRDADVRDHLTGDEPIAPAWSRYIVNDLTYEKLHSVMGENPRGILSVRDEMSGLLNDLGKEEKSEARAMYLQAWSGGSATLDRVVRGTVRVDDVCLSMIGGIQPSPLSALIEKARRGQGNDGMLERFLIAYPDAPGAWREVDRFPDSNARRTVREVFDRLDKMTAEAIGAQRAKDADGESYGRGLLRFAPDARELFAKWRSEFMPRVQVLAGDHESLAAALSKFAHHVPALALVLHVVDGAAGPVSLQSVKRALGLSEYFESHATRLHASGRRAIVRAATQILKRIKKGDLTPEFRARDIYTRGWSGLADARVVNDAAEMLVVHGWLHETALPTGPTGGRPTTVYTLAEGARHG